MNSSIIREALTTTLALELAGRGILVEFEACAEDSTTNTITDKKAPQ